MARRKPRTTRGGVAEESSPATGSTIYSEMLAEAGVAPISAADRSSATPKRPAKRARRQSPQTSPAQIDSQAAAQAVTEASSGSPRKRRLETASPVQKSASHRQSTVEAESDSDLEFEDVLQVPEPVVQTIEEDSDSETDYEFEDVRFENLESSLMNLDSENSKPREIELDLNPKTASRRAEVERRRPLTREEKGRRQSTHKVHLLCLLSHVSRRNHWCNDAVVQANLRPLLNSKTVDWLTPGSHLSQFGKKESMQKATKWAQQAFCDAYDCEWERGFWRPRWADDVQDLQHYTPPEHMEQCYDRKDFRKYSQRMRGSRDVGAQLLCALMRSVGVRARLVCSLQPLSVDGAGPPLKIQKPTSNTTISEKKSSSKSTAVAAAASSSLALSAREDVPVARSARRRLGHPDAASFHFKPPRQIPSPRGKTPNVTSETRHLSQDKYPVYWVEVLDVGYQKWRPLSCFSHPDNPLFWEPKYFEPPLHDRDNILSYVVAFDADGTAKDVTRRYAKSYTAKTRKLRIDSGAVEGGEKFWRRALKMFRSIETTDLDQIEDNELNALSEKEPMPKNISDFKDHPIFALERHFRRHEVLIPGATPSGTVRASRIGPVEKIYRRKHIRVARTADKWFRQGREVKPMEIPVKWLPKRVKPRGRFAESDEEDGDEEAAAAALAGVGSGGGGGGLNGQPLYTIEQTDLYEPPPVRNGKVPKTKFGNIEIYVPSMVPRGGKHIRHDLAKWAAHMLGVDYAPALTGFSFKGRHGTAILDGVVIAEEHAEAVEAAAEGLEAVRKEEEAQEKRMAVVAVWRRWLMGLRIRESVWEGAGEEERRDAEREVERVLKEKGYPEEEEKDYAMGGGFMIEGETEGEAGGGGFVVDDAGGETKSFGEEEAGTAEGGGFLTDAAEQAVSDSQATALTAVDDEDGGGDGGGGGFEKWLQGETGETKGDDGQDEQGGHEEERAGDNTSEATEEYDVYVDEDDEMGGGFVIDDDDDE